MLALVGGRANASDSRLTPFVQDLSPSSQSLIFPDLLVNTIGPLQFLQLTNTGNAPIQIGQVTTTGSYLLGAQIGGCLSSVGGGTGTGILLGVGQSCPLPIAAFPKTVGANNGVLTIPSDSGPPLLVALFNNGLSPLKAASSSLIFPDLLVNTIGPLQLLQLTNVGANPIQIGKVTTTGSYLLGAQIGGCLSSVGGGEGSGILLGPGQSCPLPIAAYPRALGMNFGVLTIPSDAQTPVLIALFNNGLPNLVANSQSLTFADLPAGTIGPLQFLQLTNTGNAPIQIGQVTTTGSYLLGAQIGGCLSSVGGGTGTGILLGVGQSCPLPIAAFPKAAGPNNGTLTISSDGQPDPLTVALLNNGLVAPNTPPVVNAGPDLQITLPSLATLNGTVTDDGLPQGAPLTVAWSKLSGPGTVTFSTPQAAVTTAAFSSPGSYVLRLSATDTEFTVSDDATVTVDAAPSLAIDDVSVTEGDTGTKLAIFTVTLSAASKSTVSVDYTTTDGTANAGSDYIAAAGTLTFAPGITVQTIDVVVIGDFFNEPNETFFVNLSNPANAVLGKAQGVGTIIDDDAPGVPLLQRLVASFQLDKGRETSLLAKLRAECGPLKALTNEIEAQFGKDLTPAQAIALHQAATQLLIDLGCAPSQPMISSFIPLSGPVGAPVTITGSSFLDITSVTFAGGAEAGFTIVSPVSIKAIVPAGATTGKISVTTAAGTAISAAIFKVTPKIDSFTPASGLPGTSVTINGTNFMAGGTTPTVRFGTAIGPVTTSTMTQIVATVPPSATTGKISVTTADGTGTSATDFVVILVPKITSFTPAMGAPGVVVSINGLNFSGVSGVTFGGIAATTITPVSATSIKAIVPHGAHTGSIAVTNAAGTGISSGTFTVLPSPAPTTVLAGDFNGDGRSDLAEFNSSTGTWRVGISNGSSFTFANWAAWSSAVTWADLRVGDFNGDGRADIAGRVLGTGQWWVGLSTGAGFTTTLWTTWSPAVTWVDVQVGDFNGDGRADIVGRVSSTGQWWVGLSSGTAFNNTLWATWSAAVPWTFVRARDFSGDGRADIAAYTAGSAEWWVGVSNGTTFTTTLWATE
ncbi:MAG TPA: IPT/TIG domain-containing protein [Candidatus Limnocylindria bacterium]|nr:IPT/TIG domain-containing protein [Candidatus Limnocylindria bacterium]